MNIRVNEVALDGHMNATELADYLVRKGMPFRDAHEVVGKVVMRAIDLKTQIEDLKIEELQKFSSLIETDVYEALSVEQTINAKSQTGGTARASVMESLARARHALAESSPDR
jgi:argininosuccinate lyase